MRRYSCVKSPKNICAGECFTAEGTCIKTNDAFMPHSTGQRGQTIDKMDVSGIQALQDRYRITTNDKLKHAKPRQHLDNIWHRLTYWHSLKNKLCRKDPGGVFTQNIST